MTKNLKNPKAPATSTQKDESNLSRLTTKSHRISTGPEFHPILFNCGGQSPLLLYYLKTHEPASFAKIAKQGKMKLTQISQEPTAPAPTYHDVIKEAKRQFAKNQKDFRMEKQRIYEEIKLLRQRQERIDKELDRLQAKAAKRPQEARNDFEHFVYKLNAEDQLGKEFAVPPSSSSSSSPSSSSSIMTEYCKYTEDEC